MIYLVDTNVLLRSIQARDAMYKDARQGTAALINRQPRLSVISQNLIEFWAVATRPVVNNGLALSLADTAAHIENFLETFTLLPDTSGIFPEWQQLVELHAVSGTRCMMPDWWRRCLYTVQHTCSHSTQMTSSVITKTQ